MVRRRTALADGLMLAGATLFALDLMLALAHEAGWADAGATWLGGLALGSSSLAFGSLWLARYRGVSAPPPGFREPASG